MQCRLTLVKKDREGTVPLAKRLSFFLKVSMVEKKKKMSMRIKIIMINLSNHTQKVLSIILG